MLNFDSIELNLCLDFYELLLVHTDEFKVFPCNVVIIVLHFSEGLFVILQELIDVLILPFLNLMDFNFHSQVKLIVKFDHLTLVSLDQINSFFIKLPLELPNFEIKVFLFVFNMCGVTDLVSDILVLVFLLVLNHVLFVVGMVRFFFRHQCVGLNDDLFLVIAVLVLQMLNLLLVNLNLSFMVFL